MLNKNFEDMREKEKLSWELTNLWHDSCIEIDNYKIHTLINYYLFTSTLRCDNAGLFLKRKL